MLIGNRQLPIHKVWLEVEECVTSPAATETPMSNKNGKKSRVRRSAGSGSQGIPLAAKMARPIDVYVGGRLKQVREASGMNLTQVSAEVAVSETSIAGYELGKERPPTADLIALAKLFGITLAELFPESSGQVSGRLH